MNILKWVNKLKPSYDFSCKQLFKKLEILEERYNALLLDLKRLEEENIETTNNLYELENSIKAVDSRIDILVTERWSNDNV
jgi:septal ring factor EnvC (AmiA/AmiB activator)